jgi:hypothetical protein
MTSSDRPARRRRRPAVLAWACWALALLCLAPIGWFDQLLRQAGRPDLVQLNATAVPYLLGVVSATTVGAVVAARRPRHPVGWLLLALGLSVAVNGVTDGYALYGAVARPGSLPVAAQEAVLSEGISLVGRACLAFVLLLTPTGSLPSPRWRWWARVAVAGPAVWLVARALVPRPLFPPFQSIPNPLAVHVLVGPLRTLWAVAAIVTTLGLVVAVASLVVRFRRARGVERQQLRWVALAAGVSGMVALVSLAGQVLGNDAVVTWASGALVAILPLAIGAAVLRYRLYDLDRIISRTVGWALLTVLLGLGYAAVVLALGRLLPDRSSLAVAADTRAVAAAFQPARRRLQAAVDRRFNRRRHDAARVIEGFGARLRDQVDLDTLTGEVLAVVQQTIQPTQAWLWLRPPPVRG